MLPLLIFIIVILLICLCLMHFNFQKGIDVYANALVEIGKRDAELTTVKSENARLVDEVAKLRGRLGFDTSLVGSGTALGGQDGR